MKEREDSCTMHGNKDTISTFSYHLSSWHHVSKAGVLLFTVPDSNDQSGHQVSHLLNDLIHCAEEGRKRVVGEGGEEVRR